MAKKQEMIHALNELIQVCKDAEKGYRKAATDMENQEYRAMFWSIAGQRAKFALELQEQVRKLGSKPVKEGTAAGRIHRGWLDLRYQMNLHQSKDVVFLECLRGEESGLEVYQDIFEKKLLSEQDPMLQDQFLKMMEARDQLRDIVAGKTAKAADESLLHL